MLVTGFLAYATGLVEPHVALERMPELWSGSAAAYLQAVELEPGWHWARALHRSDFLALAAISFLASCSILCLAGAAPVFYRDGERTLAWLCLIEIAVIVLAASGLLTIGH